MVDNEKQKDKEFGTRLLKWREGHLLSQTDLSKILGVDSQTISEWERGNVAPNTRRLRKLVEKFPDINLDLLINGPRVAQAGIMCVGDRLGSGNMYEADEVIAEIVQFLRKNKTAKEMILAMIRGMDKTKK